MIPQSLANLLGLCQRAGKTASGDLAAEQALKKRKGDLLILAEDASDRTAEKFIKLAEQAGIRYCRIGTRDELGDLLGKSHRSAVVIQSKDFAKGIVGILEKEGLALVSGRG